jgi:hypothetical protein
LKTKPTSAPKPKKTVAVDLLEMIERLTRLSYEASLLVDDTPADVLIGSLQAPAGDEVACKELHDAIEVCIGHVTAVVRGAVFSSLHDQYTRGTSTPLYTRGPIADSCVRLTGAVSQQGGQSS